MHRSNYVCDSMVLLCSLGKSRRTESICFLTGRSWFFVFEQTFRRSSIVNQSSWDNNIVRSRSIFFAVSSSDSTGSFAPMFLLVRVFDAFCLFDDFGYGNKAYFRMVLKRATYCRRSRWRRTCPCANLINIFNITIVMS